MFTDPLTVSSDKFSYPIPTMSALKGITEQIYWKPTFKYEVTEVTVLNEIKRSSENILLVGMQTQSGKTSSQLARYSFLDDVCYLVKVRMIWNESRPDLMQDRDFRKHTSIFNRYLKRGGKRNINLGTSECNRAYVIPLTEYEFTNSFYEGKTLEFPSVFCGYTYPDVEGVTDIYAKFSPLTMVNGVIKYPRLDDCVNSRYIKTVTKTYNQIYGDKKEV